jgi:predicted small secreted protein
MNRVWILILLMSVSAFSSGCNTVEGVGEDMQDAGREIQEEV